MALFLRKSVGFCVSGFVSNLCFLMIKADQTLARLAVLWGVIVITCCIGTAIFAWNGSQKILQ